MTNEYLELKKNELDFLNISPITSTDPISLFKIKNIRFKDIRRNLGNDNSLTDIHQKKYTCLGNNVHFTYQRQGIIFEYPVKLYPLLPSSSGLIFTRSGQSSNFIVISRLFEIYENINLIVDDSKIYFETLKILEGFNYSTTYIENKFNVKLVDTSFDYTENLNDIDDTIDLLIIDTTCIDLSDNFFSDLVFKKVAQQKPIILTRSHVKLDCLGAEFGILGSIFLLNYEKLFFKKEFNRDRFPENFLGNLMERTSLIGAYSFIDDIYPFLLNDLFLQLTNNRTSRIVNNTQLYYLEFKKYLSENFQMENYEHGLYFKICIKRKFSTVDHDLIAKNVLKSSQITGMKIIICDSFAFDFANLTIFNHYKDSYLYLRFSGSDNSELSQTQYKKFIKIFSSFLNRAFGD